MPLTPTDMVLIFLVTKPVFLLGCLLLVVTRHSYARQERARALARLPAPVRVRALLEEQV